MSVSELKKYFNADHLPPVPQTENNSGFFTDEKIKKKRILRYRHCSRARIDCDCFHPNIHYTRNPKRIFLLGKRKNSEAKSESTRNKIGITIALSTRIILISEVLLFEKVL